MKLLFQDPTQPPASIDINCKSLGAGPWVDGDERRRRRPRRRRREVESNGRSLRFLDEKTDFVTASLVLQYYQL